MDLSWIWPVVALAGLIVTGLALLTARKPPAELDLTPVFDRLQAIKSDVERLDRTMREDAARADEGLRKIGADLRVQAAEAETRQKAALDDSRQVLKAMMDSMLQRLDANRVGLDEAAKSLREELAKQMGTLREENSQKLEVMRQTVDEKLQGTLEKRLGESFKQVSERLEQVHRGLGEMQTLAGGVGDLKRMLTNVKTRGTWGEVQLSNLLDQIFAPDQYHRNWATKQGSKEIVEIAIRLPGRGPNEPEVLLPIDAKFPREDYERLIEAAERGDAEGVEAASKGLDTRLKNAAKDIRDKYIAPPHTTDFALMFLPTEGLYAEALRRPGLTDLIQREYRVTITGPTTLLALLNSLQMGFRTLAIEKRSSEVWQVLGAIKAEFTNYGTILDKVKKKLEEASSSVDAVGVRQKAIVRKLKTVEIAPDGTSDAVLGLLPQSTGLESDD
jgi:DNA recombination protein RmuC